MPPATTQLPGDSQAQSTALSPPQPLLSVSNLHVHFPVKSPILQRTTSFTRAVDGVSFHLSRGETLGIVGESGCGKTTAGRAILRLTPPASTTGTVIFENRDVYAASGKDLKALRRHMQIIFQDPAGSMNPRMRVLDIVAEPLIVHSLATDPAELRARVERCLHRCGMPGKSVLDRYPHEFSGGQRQRIAIARALALEPSFIVCDEPTSALDVSIQAQILNLLKDLQRDLGLSYLFISHDMAVIQHMCDRIAVMHKGKIVETGTKHEVIGSPRDEYTRALLRAVPVARPRPRDCEAVPTP